MASIRERLGANAVPVQLPLGEAEKHQGVIDLIRRRAYVFEDGGSEGREFAVLPVPAEYREAVEAARLRLIEAASDFDDEALCSSWTDVWRRSPTRRSNARSAKARCR